MKVGLKKLMLILGCSMLMVGQVSVVANAEEGTAVQETARKALLPAENLKWDDGRMTFDNPNEGEVFFEFQVCKDGEVIKKGYLNGGNQFSETHCESTYYYQYFATYGAGSYTFRLRAVADGESDWSAYSEPYVYSEKKAQLPAPKVEAGENGMVTVTLPDDSYTLGSDYEFIYKLYFMYDGYEVFLSDFSSKENTMQFNLENGTHMVYVTAKSLNEEIGHSAQVGPITLNNGSAGGASKSTSSNGCKHDFEWVAATDATATENALEAYTCKKCGRVSEYMEVSNSAYAKFNKDAVAAIDKADVNGTVTIKTNMWVSFCAPVIDMLKTRSDVTVVLNYFYNGTYYTMTIPAGADLSVLADSEGYYGFRYLDLFFPGQAVK